MVLSGVPGTDQPAGESFGEAAFTHTFGSGKEKSMSYALAVQHVLKVLFDKGISREVCEGH